MPLPQAYFPGVIDDYLQTVYHLAFRMTLDKDQAGEATYETFLRAYYDEHRVQAQVRAMIWHFAKVWGPERGNNHYLHVLFPVGGPQKQGNRLAGLLKTKGEH